MPQRFFLTVTDFGGLNGSSPLAGEDRPRSGQMRGTTREKTVAIRGSPSGKPWTSMAFWLAPPSSGPSGHLPPRGGKAVMFTTLKIRDGQAFSEAAAIIAFSP